MIFTSQRRAEHLFGGQNTQQTRQPPINLLSFYSEESTICSEQFNQSLITSEMFFYLFCPK